MADLVFGIGGDNSELKSAKDESLQIIEQWVQSVTSRFESISGLEIPTGVDDLPRGV